MTIESRQTIESYHEVVGRLGEHLTEDYMGAKSDVKALIEYVESLQPQFGSGSPEGAVTSNRNRTYYDTSGASVILYVNPNIGVSTGWEQV